jgi:hypothetical protein
MLYPRDAPRIFLFARKEELEAAPRVRVPKDGHHASITLCFTQLH